MPHLYVTSVMEDPALTWNVGKFLKLVVLKVVGRMTAAHPQHHAISVCLLTFQSSSSLGSCYHEMIHVILDSSEIVFTMSTPWHLLMIVNKTISPLPSLSLNTLKTDHGDFCLNLSCFGYARLSKCNKSLLYILAHFLMAKDVYIHVHHNSCYKTLIHIVTKPRSS